MCIRDRYGDYYITPDDWEKELLDNGNLRQEYNVNISGSTEKMNYYMSALSLIHI